MNTHNFKGMMSDATADSVPIDQIIREGKTVFFAMDEMGSYLRYFASTELDVQIDEAFEAEYCTDAFKFIRLIAD